jgi:hypothetical protein
MHPLSTIKNKNMKSFKLIVLAGAFAFGLVLSLNYCRADDSTFSFAVIGDSRGSIGNSKHPALKAAANQIAKKTSGPVFPLGDEVNSCYGDAKCIKDFKQWKKMMGKLISRTYPIVGNHDRTNGKADTTWQNTFSLPQNGPEGFKDLTYSFDYQDAHFVVLDSEKPSMHLIDSSQRDWLDQDLTNNTKKYTFVFYHEPAFAISREVSDSLDFMPSERDALWNILDKHNVTAVFNGHEHLYGRKKIDSGVYPAAQNTIYQFTVGNTDVKKADKPKAGLSAYSYTGKSFAIVKVDATNITVNLYTIAGNLINSFSFTK